MRRPSNEQRHLALYVSHKHCLFKTHTKTHSLSLSHTNTPRAAAMRCPTNEKRLLALSHIQTISLTQKLSLSHTNTHTNTVSLSHTKKKLSLSHTNTLALTLSLSLTHTESGGHASAEKRVEAHARRGCRHHLCHLMGEEVMLRTSRLDHKCCLSLSLPPSLH